MSKLIINSKPSNLKKKNRNNNELILFLQIAFIIDLIQISADEWKEKWRRFCHINFVFLAA